jgi:hypothetical protein
MDNQASFSLLGTHLTKRIFERFFKHYTGPLTLTSMTFNASPNIRAVSTTADLELFLDVPQYFYANDPNWVPPLRSAT